MKFNYEDKFQFLIVLFLSAVTTYVLSKEIMVTVAVAIALTVIYKVISKRNIVFKDEIIEVNSSVFSKKNFTCSYNEIKTVSFEQIYTTTYVNVIVKIIFEIQGRKRETKFDVAQYSRIADLIRWLNKRNVKYIFKDEHLEIEIGKYLSV